MALARSRITAQGQISVPARVREKLGVGPGSVLEWEDDAGRIVVRRAGLHDWVDIHRALFPNGPPKRRSLEALKQGIRQYIRKKHARR